MMNWRTCLLVLGLVSACESGQYHCKFDGGDACRDFIGACNRGDLSACGLLLHSSVTPMQRLDAAAAGCRSDIAFCDPLASDVAIKALKGVKDEAPRRKQHLRDLELACTSKHYANACLVLGADDDPARAAHFYAIGCASKPTRYSYTVPAIPPYHEYTVDGVNSPSDCCDQLAELYAKRTLAPPSPDFIAGLRARSDKLLDKELSNLDSQAADRAAERQARIEAFDRDLEALSAQSETNNQAFMQSQVVMEQSKQATRTNITATVQASDARRVHSAGAAQRDLAGPPPQTQTPKPDTKLADCLAQPAPRMRTVQTNPFPSYVPQYELLAIDAAKCSDATTSKWKSCIGAIVLIWPDAPASADLAEFSRRYNAVMPYMTSQGGSACLDDGFISSERSGCITMGKEICVKHLKEAADTMRCAEGLVNRIWDGEIARNDADARQKQDDDCRRRFH